MSRTACAVLALLAFVALLVVQFNLPWANHEESGFGATAEATVRTWDLKGSGSFGGFSGSDTKGWYDGGWDDEDKNAVTQLQIAAPALVAATVLLLVGTILSFTSRGSQGAIITLVGAILAAAATLLYFLASQDLLDNEATWLVGFYLGLTATILGLAGGVVGLAAGNMRGAAN
ncbi:MAG TPA: hypothetical protein VM327_03590 [Candidatus Thermoplasmatota archaeon]|nr:hypothetical protein [Candidatus Thermoplasmatota archaeon]